MIPESQWQWLGHAGHFIASSKCLFHLSTKVGRYLVSTVGDYHPDGPSSERHCLGGDDDSYYETMVFIAHKRLPCGCYGIDGRNLECKRYPTARKAHSGHLRLCHMYSKLSGREAHR